MHLPVQFDKTFYAGGDGTSCGYICGSDHLTDVSHSSQSTTPLQYCR